MVSDSPPSPLSHVLETILYTKSQEESRAFYKGILGLQTGFESPRGTRYPLGNTNLLIFTLGLAGEDLVDDPEKPEIRIPRHGPTAPVMDVLVSEEEGESKSLRQHFCLAADSRADVEGWEKFLIQKGVVIMGRMNWELGGYSIYFSDPDGHVGEIASRGTWPNY